MKNKIGRLIELIVLAFPIFITWFMITELPTLLLKIVCGVLGVVFTLFILVLFELYLSAKKFLG